MLNMEASVFYDYILSNIWLSVVLAITWSLIWSFVKWRV